MNSNFKSIKGFKRDGQNYTREYYTHIDLNKLQLRTEIWKRIHACFVIQTRFHLSTINGGFTFNAIAVN